MMAKKDWTIDILYYQKGDEVKGGNDANGGAEGGTGREWVHYCLITVHLEIIFVNLEIIFNFENDRLV